MDKKEATKDLVNRFRYHPANSEEKQMAHKKIRDRSFELAHYFATNIPEGRELSLAITKLEEAMFWANAGIARDGER